MSDPMKVRPTVSGGPSHERLATLDPKQFGRAMDAAVAAGQQIAKDFPSLSRRQRLRIASLFRRQLLPPGKPGRNGATESLRPMQNGKRGCAAWHSTANTSRDGTATAIGDGKRNRGLSWTRSIPGKGVSGKGSSPRRHHLVEWRTGRRLSPATHGSRIIYG